MHAHTYEPFVSTCGSFWGSEVRCKSFREREAGSSGMMYRRDIFYSGSLANINAYLNFSRTFSSTSSLSRYLFTSIGFNVPYIYLPDRVTQMGISKSKATFLISVIGISNTVLFGLFIECATRRVKSQQSTA
ncbi:hypothetical protein LSAT2_010706 [Lamellibrachia satsuma]|nr:hypothetical protein LSAT2_010706 [Lamellibrachia satsuma]